MQLSNRVVYLLLVTLTTFFFCLGCPLWVLQSHGHCYVKLKNLQMTQSLTTELRCHSRVHYQSCTGLLWLMAILVTIGVFRGLMSKTYGS